MSRFDILRSRTTAATNGHHSNGSATADALQRSPVPVGDPAYLRGRAEFDSVFADLAKGKRNWQLVAFVAVGLSGILAVGLVTLATQSRITPYVVEVDQLGRAQAFGPAERLTLSDQRLVTSQLAGFVRDVRTVLADPAGQADLVRRAYAFADQEAGAFLNAYFATPANDPRLLARDATRLVEVTSVLPVPGTAPRGGGDLPTAWKVSWTETTVPRAAGAAPVVTAWEGYFGTRVVPPTSTQQITANPLGLYVTSVNWTRITARPDGATVPARGIVGAPGGVDQSVDPTSGGIP